MDKHVEKIVRILLQNLIIFTRLTTPWPHLYIFSIITKT